MKPLFRRSLAAGFAVSVASCALIAGCEKTTTTTQTPSGTVTTTTISPSADASAVMGKVNASLQDAAHAVEHDRHVRRRDVERLAKLFLVHDAVAGDEHQDRELGNLQAERIHVLREHLLHLEGGARRRIAHEVSQRRVVESRGGAARPGCRIARLRASRGGACGHPPSFRRTVPR